MKSVDAMRRECDDFSNCVHQPAKHHSRGGPPGVSFCKLFSGRRFLSSINIGRVKRAKNLIKSLEQELFDHLDCPTVSLDQPAKIININISVAKREFSSFLGKSVFPPALRGINTKNLYEESSC